MTNVIEAINELIKGINTAYARNSYTMEETHQLYSAIKFIKDAVQNQQQLQTPQTPAPQEENPTTPI